MEELWRSCGGAVEELWGEQGVARSCFVLFDSDVARSCFVLFDSDVAEVVLVVVTLRTVVRGLRRDRTPAAGVTVCQCG